MKDIDEELNAKIRTVFEDFDDGLSDQGWAALREKYPEKSRKVLPLWWISGVAACLLIALGWLLLKTPDQQDNELVKLNKTTKSTPQVSGQNDRQLMAEKPEELTERTNAEQHNPQGIKNLQQVETPIFTKPEKQRELVAVTKQPENQNNTEIGIPLSIKTDLPQTAALQNTDNTVASTNLKTENENSVASLPSATKKTTEQFLSEQTKIAARSENKNQTKEKNTKSSFEVFTGTFLNYSGSNDVKVNAGFGLNANIKVSKSVFLAVGAGVSQNKTAFENQNTVTSNMVSDAPSYNDASVIYTSSPFVTDAKLSAQLLAIDLPITVKFYPTKKQNFYIATGINSNTYLTQQYTYSYNVVTPSAISRAPQPAEDVENVRSGGFDFANSAIFAIGINQNIGKNKLIFEPYFKPAIGNMGDKNLRINTIGINLRFSFTDK